MSEQSDEPSASKQTAIGTGAFGAAPAGQNARALADKKARSSRSERDGWPPRQGRGGGVGKNDYYDGYGDDRDDDRFRRDRGDGRFYDEKYLSSKRRKDEDDFGEPRGRGHYDERTGHRDRSPGRGRDSTRRDSYGSHSPDRGGHRAQEEGADKEEDDVEEFDEFGRVIVKSSKAKVATENMSEEEQMQAMLGFGGFGSTKNKTVADNESGAAKGAVAVSGTRQYRQYMNRTGGFNQSLGKVKQTKRPMK